MDTVDPNLPTLAPADKALEVKEEYATRYRNTPEEGGHDVTL